MIQFSPKKTKQELLLLILDVESYIEKRNKEINTENCYKKLNQYPTLVHTKIINDQNEALQQQQVLPKNICDNLKTTKVRTSHFYLTPKVYKNIYIPGKPVESSIDCYTGKTPEFFDTHLKPHAKPLPSYFQDTTNSINKQESKNSILVFWMCKDFRQTFLTFQLCG